MALSQQVSDSLDEAKANLRNALSFAARTEEHISVSTLQIYYYQ